MKMIDTVQDLAICMRDLNNALIAAECQQLTGSKPERDGLAFCDALEHISRAAYVNAGARGIIQTSALADLLIWIRHTRFQADAFHIELVDWSNAGLPSKLDVVIEVANAIRGHPNLKNPQRRFVLIVSEDSVWFGELTVAATHSYRQHDRKPRRTAGSLPSALARALVNLAGPHISSIVNPCCGTGSILLEACALGLEAHGVDWSGPNVKMSRRNLSHFGYTASVIQIDASNWTQTADALISDLPYGTAHPLDESVVFELLRNAVYQAPIAIFVAAKNLSTQLQQAGFCDIELFRIKKSKVFSRYVHRAQSPVFMNTQPCVG